MPFRRRLILFLVVALVGVQVLTAFLGYSVVQHNISDEGKRELAQATDIFIRQLDVLSERVGNGVEILALDYGLRQAIARRDHATSLSALRNLSRRIGAHRMFLVGLDGRIAVDTARPTMADGPFQFPDLIDDASAGRHGTALANLDGAIYWIVVVPVKAPLPIGYIAAGVPVDDALLNRLSQLSSLHTSIALATTDTRGRWTTASRSSGFTPALGNLALANGGADHTVEGPDGDSYLTLAAPLPTTAHSKPVRVVLTYPLDAALAPYRALILPLVIVLAIGLGIAIVGAIWSARGVSRPIESLAAGARRIAEGDYTAIDIPDRRDEIGDLANALSAMTIAIAERETALTGAVSHLELARNEAVRADAAKSQFLANMSHELRTPLNAIIGFSEMLAGAMLGPLGHPRYKEYARDIEGSGQHLLAIIERMLDLSKSEAGQLAIAHERIMPGALLSKSVAMLAPIAAKGGVELLTKGNLTAWPAMVGDPVRLKQAFVNLVHNAIKFTPAGGMVTVSGGVSKGHLFICIEDTGIGIEQQSIGLVLRPFHRLSSAFDGRYQGSGLGLPYAKAVVDLHGGSLTIESRVSVGTVIVLDLPLSAEADGISEAA